MIERHEIIVPPLPLERATVYRHTGRHGVAASVALLDWIIANRARSQCDAALKDLVDAMAKDRDRPA